MVLYLLRYIKVFILISYRGYSLGKGKVSFVDPNEETKGSLKERNENHGGEEIKCGREGTQLGGVTKITQLSGGRRE